MESVMWSKSSGGR